MTASPRPAIRIDIDGTVAVLPNATYETIHASVGGWIEATFGCLAAGDRMAGPCVITGPIDPDGQPEPVSGDLPFTVLWMAAAVKRHRKRPDRDGADGAQLGGDLWAP